MGMMTGASSHSLTSGHVRFSNMAPGWFGMAGHLNPNDAVDDPTAWGRSYSCDFGSVRYNMDVSSRVVDSRNCVTGNFYWGQAQHPATRSPNWDTREGTVTD